MIKRWAWTAQQPWASDAKAEVRNPFPLEPIIRWPWFLVDRGSQHANFQSSRLPTIARVKQRPPNCWRRFAWKRWEALVIQDERSWILMFLNSLFLNSCGMFWEQKLFWEHILTQEGDTTSVLFKKWLVLELSTLSWGLSKSHPHRKEIFLFVSHTFIRPYEKTNRWVSYPFFDS